MNLSRKWGYETHHMVHPPPGRWEPFAGNYPFPTDLEFEIIYPYLLKYEFEDDDFVEEDNEHWLALKKKYRCPNLRAICMEFLHVVRWSKGYDLTEAHRLEVFGDGFFPVSPHNDVKLYKICQDAAVWAIDQIDTEEITRGKKYQFLSLDNAVWINILFQPKLLTITVKEFDADVMEIDGADDDDTYDYEAKTIRAIVEGHSKFELLEWKFEVDQSETCPSISNLSLLG